MIEILRKRRSIRKYQATAIDSQAMEVIKEALLRSPSSRGTNPWTFIFVDQKDLLRQAFPGQRAGSAIRQRCCVGCCCLRRRDKV